MLPFSDSSISHKRAQTGFGPQFPVFITQFIKQGAQTQA